jgi:uncharacterized membrane protein
MPEDGTAPEIRGDDADGPGAEPPTAAIEDLLGELGELETRTPDPETDETIRSIKQLLVAAHGRGLIESDVRSLDARDVAEAFIGSVVFAAPLLVEDGVFDIADHLFGVAVRGIPVFLIANTLFVVLVTHALIEWTGRDRVERRTFLKGIPARLLVTLAVSFLVATLLMTIWGRVNGWQSPAETLARINVLWTVGSLGGALGDILANDDTPENVMRSQAARVAGTGIESASPIDPPDAVRQLTDGALLDALHQQFDELEAAVDDATNRHEVTQIRTRAIEATLEDAFGDRIEKYTSRDIAEAFVGSIVFSIPFLVEDGVFDVAEYFLSFRIGPVPVFFVAHTAFVLVVISGLVYWAGPQDVTVTRPVLGVIPRRLIGTAVVAFLTASALMTLWGRVDHWQDPVVAVARISVVWTVAAFGAALGDILPGESSGADINDDLAALGDRPEEGEESASAEE